MMTIKVGNLKSREDIQSVVAQLQALQANGLENIQLQIKGQESRRFLSHLASEYDRKQASLQRMISSLLLGSAGGLASIILGIVLWL